MDPRIDKLEDDVAAIKTVLKNMDLVNHTQAELKKRRLDKRDFTQRTTNTKFVAKEELRLESFASTKVLYFENVYEMAWVFGEPVIEKIISAIDSDSNLSGWKIYTQ